MDGHAGLASFPFPDGHAEVLQDEEGLQIMRVLGRNMAWLLKLKAAGEAAGIKLPKQEERRIATNFFR